MCVYIYLYITIKPINIIRFSEKATFHVTNRRKGYNPRPREVT